MDAPSVDLREHVRVDPLPAGSGEAEVLERIERLRSRRLDPSRPLWEVWFLPGLSDGRVAMYVRLHHSLADGMAAMRTIDRFLDAEPDPPATSAPPGRRRRLRPDGPPNDHLRRRRRKLGARSVCSSTRRTLRRARDAWPAVRELFAEEPADRTSLDRTVGPAAGSR